MKHSKFKIFIILCLFLSLLACNKESIITKEDLLNDYDYLWQVLEADYMYLPLVKENIDIQSLKKDTRESINDNTTSMELQSILDDMFSQMDNLGHLSTLKKYSYARYVESLTEDNYPKIWQQMLLNENTKKYYNFLPDQNSYFSEWKIECSYDKLNETVFFKIHTFAAEVLERDKDVIKNYINSLNSEKIKNVVIDITSNGGGNTNYWRENIVQPLGYKGSFTLDLFIKENALTKKYYLDDNYMNFDTISDYSTYDKEIKELNLTHHTSITEEFDYTKEVNIDANYYVLVDENVYSAAENFVVFCKKTGWATVIGKPTKGDGVGVDPILVALPNSGIVIRFSAIGGLSDDNKLDIHGSKPDIMCAKYEAPLTTFYRIINNKYD